MPDIGLDPRYFTPERIRGCTARSTCSKPASLFADAISTVSRGYAREIQTPEYGFGLDRFAAGPVRRG